MAGANHPKARQYATLLSGVKRFEELEGKIEALATPNERGAAFEVFAEAYLATTRKMQAKSVWSDTSVPIKLAKKFRLPFPEKGADGLFETVSGEYHAYQVKFRTNRPSLTWGELSTFVGITDHLDHRLQRKRRLPIRRYHRLQRSRRLKYVLAQGIP